MPIQVPRAGAFFTMSTKREILQAQLKNQFLTDFADNGYKSDFTPDASFTECNFGGMLIIISLSGDSVIHWSDWSDTAISAYLKEAEIVYQENSDSKPDTEGNKEMEAGFYVADTFHSLSNFLRL